MFDSPTGADLSIEIGEIAVIKVIKKSKAWTIGAVGLGVGAFFGLVAVSDLESLIETEPTTSAVIIWTAFFGALCAVPGVLIGAFLGTDKSIRLEGKSPEEIKAVMEELRSKARVREFQ